MKVILKSGRKISVTKEEGINIQEFLMSSSDNLYIRTTVKTWYGTFHKVFKVSDISVVY